ncbi:MAG: 16S rRNA (cytosine(967)-C(5))-methyltransferase RsmB [Lautropia sp.]
MPAPVSMQGPVQGPAQKPVQGPVQGPARAALAQEFAACAGAVAATLEGQHLDRALDTALHGASADAPARSPRAADPAAPLPAASRAPVRDMAYATLRTLGTTRFLAHRLNARPPAPRLAALQCVALTALLDGRRAPAIVVDEAVAAARALSPGAAGEAGSRFVNATLRRFLRERDALLALARADREASCNLPGWWVESLIRHYPRDWRDIVDASTSKAPLTVRVNARATDVDAVTRRFDQASIAWRRTGVVALTLEHAIAVERIPGFVEGLVTVQDAGAQLAAPLLAPRDGDRVLDACAAPGGKTTHLLELAACEVVALELDPRRAERIQENLRRQRLEATVLQGDATRPGDWWDGRRFDRIMLDAPCSASGIVRRHPDVPWHRRRRDIATFAATQRRLLDALWPLLKPGGTLVYVTCSIFPEEGEDVITAFCSHHSDAGRRVATVRWADGESAAAQLLPTRPAGQGDCSREHDGFFYALLSKRT